MNEHFIKNIEVDKFKCFNKFKAEGFTRVNLIGGKNNVGKTAFLETTYINSSSKNVNTLFSSIYDISFTRNNMEFLDNKISSIITEFENTKSYFSKSNISEIDYKLINKDGQKKYSFSINKKENIINANNFSYQLERINNIEYIDNFGFTNGQLQNTYITIQTKNKEQLLDKYINEFDENIENFKIIGDKNPVCKVKGIDDYIKINEFGDGLKHYISIICSLFACSDGYLFIDEIDNGIHYTMMDKVWGIILKISKEQNVQVFATTHSQECISSFNKSQKKLEDKDSLYFEIYNNIKENILQMRHLDEEQLEYELSHKGKFRGE